MGRTVSELRGGKEREGGMDLVQSLVMTAAETGSELKSLSDLLPRADNVPTPPCPCSCVTLPALPRSLDLSLLLVSCWLHQFNSMNLQCEVFQ